MPSHTLSERRKRGLHKVAKVMREFHAGTLKSGSGHMVTDVGQAKAIAMSEGGLSRKRRRRKRG